MIETGKILQQRYRIDKQIGQGGMGAVYVATDERFGSIVAIKETLFMDDNYRKAIEREARLLNSLKHTALPRVSDHFLEENGQFLVMEYIPGEDLAFMLERDAKPFSVEQVIVWADQLLDALDFLHNQQNPVIHRDIKPQNLKITAKGQIILLDFGLAKGNPTDAGHLTAAKSIFGYSRNYASLEQIQGTGTDPRSDLYSLAATLYHLVTGQPPEDALTRAMSVLSHQPDPLVPAHTLRIDIPVGLSGILQNTLDLNASARPQTAVDMRQMLKDPERYEHLAVQADHARGLPVADLSSARTRLMPGSTRQTGDRQTHVRTEILPAYISGETAVRSTDPNEAAGENAARFAGSNAGTGRRFGRRLAYATMAGLLLIGSIVAGAYVYNPAMFLHEASPASVEPETVEPVQIAPESEPSTEEAAVTAPAEDEPDVPEGEEPETRSAAPRNEPARVPTRTASKTSRSAAGSKNTAADIDMGDFDLDGKTIHIGNMKIKNGRVETPDTYIDENGITRKTPKVNVVPTAPPDLRYLTPAQRRRVLLDWQRRTRRIPPPANTTQNKP